MSVTADQIKQGMKALVVSLFPFLSDDFRRRHPLRATVLSSADGKATVQLLTRGGDPDAGTKTLADLHLPPYCKSLGAGSVVRVAFAYWDSGRAYIEGIESAVTPWWRLESGAGIVEVAPASSGMARIARGNAQFRCDSSLASGDKALMEADLGSIEIDRGEAGHGVFIRSQHNVVIKSDEAGELVWYTYIDATYLGEPVPTEAVVNLETTYVYPPPPPDPTRKPVVFIGRRPV